MAGTNIDAVFAQIEKDFVELSKAAAKSAATKAQKDIQNKADKFVEEYYASYRPHIYKRQNALYKLVTPYYKEKETGSGMKIEFGVKYNSSKIKGIHKSSSWWHQSGGPWISKDNPSFHLDKGDNGIPDPEWITDQFLSGVHPWAQTDSQSPDEKMQNFFDAELDDLVNGYISTALLEAVSKYF
jgi:hypothetical protein